MKDHFILNDDSDNTAESAGSSPSAFTSQSPPSVPTILVELHVPRECSYSSFEPPFLKVKLASTADRPITVLDCDSCLEDVIASLVTTDLKTGETTQGRPATPRSKRIPTLTWKDEDDFVTLPPSTSQRWEVWDMPFRGMSAVPYDEATMSFYANKDHETDFQAARYMRMCKDSNGMGHKIIGREYEIDLKEGSTVRWWQYGTKEELLRYLPRDVEGEVLKFDMHPLPIKSIAKTRYRVVE